MEKIWKNKWIAMLLIGILLVIVAMPTKTYTENEERYALEEEMRLKQVLEKMEGVGVSNVMITEEGIVIIADGADNGVVAKNVINVVQALFDVDSHKIKVMKRIQEE